jgi:hypothetical protein
VKTCEDVAPNFGENRPGYFTMTTLRLTLPSSPSSFWRNTKWLAPCDLFLFTKMKLKLTGRRFDTTEEIQAESQRTLDTLTEKDFQEEFQKWKRRWNCCLLAGWGYFEGDGGRKALQS